MAGTSTRAPRKAAPKKATASKISAQNAAATRAVPREEPLGRFAKLRAEVIQEPYVITATLSVEPPDKARGQMISAAQTAYSIARGQLEAMVMPLSDPAAEDGILRDDQGAPVLPPIDTDALEGLQRLVTTAADEYDKALFGEAYDAVTEYFLGEQGAVWNAFYADIQDVFLPKPATGKCPTCGHETEEQAGNAPGSTTSSSTTGTE